MKTLNALRKAKNKAVSPVVAAILLIGLVVVAGAAIAFIVLNFTNTAPTIAKIKPAVSKALSYNEVSNTTTFEISIKNENTADVQLIGFIFKNGTDTITNSDNSAGVTLNVTISAGSAALVSFSYAGGDYTAASEIVLSFADANGKVIDEKTVTFA
ncbi:MAG: type IV pilin [Candidatus Odinarchaeota archaeon]